MIKIYPGAIVFTRGFFLERKHTVGKNFTVEQLVGKHIVMKITKAMIMYIGIMSETSRSTPACIYYYYSTHRPLSSMHLEY